MSSMIVWMMGIGISVAAMVVAAAIQHHYLHMMVAAAVSIVVALAAFGEARERREAHAEAGLIASANLRHMGLVWAWGAIVIIITYTSVLAWKEWWHFALAFILLSGLCLFFSASLKNEPEGSTDAGMLSLSRYLAIGQFAATVITIVGMLTFDGRTFKVGGKMLRYLDARHTDWAANNVFLFGAVALAAISWLAIQATRER